MKLPSEDNLENEDEFEFDPRRIDLDFYEPVYPEVDYRERLARMKECVSRLVELSKKGE